MYEKPSTTQRRSAVHERITTAQQAEKAQKMQEPKSPTIRPLSPSSLSIFNPAELTRPIKFKKPNKSSSSPPKWKDLAREFEAEIRTSTFT
jgi:hypothetical protein